MNPPPAAPPDRHPRLPTLVGVILFALVLGVPGAGARPHILLLLVDDLGRQDLGLHGSTFHLTPAIDQLGREGVVFTDAYASHPRCVPSRYAILSGRNPARDGVPGFEDRGSPHVLPLARVTFAERLRDAGYATGYIGKWHLGGAGGGPEAQGFDDSRIAGKAGAPASHFHPFHLRPDGRPGSEPFPEVPGKRGEYLTDRIADEAVGFLRSRAAAEDGRPFLLVVAPYAVHTPFEAPAEDVAAARARLEAAGRAPGGTRDDPDFRTTGNATDKTVQNNPVYAAMVGRMDAGVGRILATLDELDLARDTVVILTSDHGGLSTRGAASSRPLATTNAPYRHGKGWLYEGGLRVPLIVRWPGRLEPGRTSFPTDGTDHYPTILDLAGVAPDPTDGLDGVSYRPVLEGRPAPARGPLFFHSPQARPHSTGDDDASALLDGRWKVYEHHATGRVELYDLQTDPGEQHDLAEIEPARHAAMATALRAMKERLGARQGGPNPFATPR